METKGIPNDFLSLSELLVEYVTTDRYNNEFIGKLIRD